MSQFIQTILIKNNRKKGDSIFYLSAVFILIYLSVFNIYTLEWLMNAEIHSFAKRLIVIVLDSMLLAILLLTTLPPLCHSWMANYFRKGNVIIGIQAMLGVTVLLVWQAYQIQHINILEEYGQAESELGRTIREYVKQPGNDNGKRFLQALRDRNSSFLKPDELWNDRWDNESQRKAQQLLRGDYVALMDPRDPGTPNSFPIPKINWRENLGDSLNFNLQQQLFLLDLINAAKKQSNIDYLMKAKFIALDWIRKNPLWFRSLRNNSIFQIRNNLTPFYAWIDDPTASRTIAHLTLMFALLDHGLLKPDEAIEFLASFVRHGRLLGKEEFYSAPTNHGIMQNRALLALALVFPEIPESKQWIGSALQRMEQQMTQNVSASGIHRELSVSYHFYVLRNFIYFLTLSEMHGITLPSEYEQRLRKMLVYAAEIIYPDGTSPLIGDTKGYMPSEYHIDKWPEARYKAWPETKRLAAALNGTPPPPETLCPLWEDPGIVHIRYPKAENEKDILDVVMLAARQRPNHNHFDALSIFVYRGMQLLVGPGYPSNQENDPLRPYLIGTTAHNTISVDGRSHNPGDAEITQARVLDLGKAGDKVLFVRATHQLYDDVLIERDLVVFSRDLIVLIDRARGQREHRYQQHFHFPSTLTPLIKDNQVVLIDHSSPSPLMRITSWLSAPAKAMVPAVPITVMRYEVLADKYIKAPSMAYRQDSKEATFVTTIDFDESRKFQILQLSAEAITVIIGKKRVALRFEETGITLEPIFSIANGSLRQEQQPHNLLDYLKPF